MKLSESLLYENLNYVPAAYYLKSFNPDFSMSYHIHDYFEIMYAVSGRFKIQTKNQTGRIEEKIVSEGQFVFIDSNNMHRLKIFEPCKICNLEIMIEYPKELTGIFTSAYLGKVNNFSDFASVLQDNIVLNDTENILNTLKKIHVASDKNNGDYESYLHIQSLMLYLLIDLGRCYKNMPANHQNAYIRSIYITKCIGIVNNGISEKLSPKKIAKSLSISESYLHRQFKEFLGMTFSVYVNKQSIELAKNILLNSNDSISKISESVGFGTRQYFNMVFNKYEHVSPALYRKLARQRQYNKITLSKYLQTQIDNENKRSTLIIPKSEELI